MDADRVIEVDRDRRGEAAGQRTEEGKGDSVRREGGGVVLGGNWQAEHALWALFRGGAS